MTLRRFVNPTAVSYCQQNRHGDDVAIGHRYADGIEHRKASQPCRAAQNLGVAANTLKSGERHSRHRP